jgi:hypothetical protein
MWRRLPPARHKHLRIICANHRRMLAFRPLCWRSCW